MLCVSVVGVWCVCVVCVGEWLGDYECCMCVVCVMCEYVVCMCVVDFLNGVCGVCV